MDMNYGYNGYIDNCHARPINDQSPLPIIMKISINVLPMRQYNQLKKATHNDIAENNIKGIL